MWGGNRHMRPGIVVAVLVVSLAIPATAFAASSNAALPSSLLPAKIVSDIIQTYKDATDQWIYPLEEIAKKLFWVLATLEFAWAMVRLVLRGADLADFAVELIQQLVFIGFFFQMLTHFPQYALDVIHGLEDVAGKVGGVALSNPGNIFTTGLNLVSSVTSHMGIYKVGADVALAIAAIVIMVVFALITAGIVFVIIEAHFAVAAGVFFMGLGPSRWTNTYALNVIRYVFSIAAKLFVMELVVGLGQGMIEQFANNVPSANWGAVLALLGAVIVFFVLMKSIPDMVQGFISGSNNNMGTGMVGAIAGAAGGVAAGAMAGAGMASAANEAAQLAAATSGGPPNPPTTSSQDDALLSGTSAGGGDGGDGGGPPPLTRGQLAARTAGILGRAAAADMRNRMEGVHGSRHGTMGGRMARMIRSANTNKSDVPPLTPDP